MHRTAKAALTLALAGAAIALTACGTVPTREQRTHSPQTAMRGPAYKRLIVTFSEAHQLAVKASDYAARLESEGADPDKVQAAQQLADDAAKFADDCEWFLANRRRMQWHQSHMNDLWVRWDELDESNRGTVLAYTDDDLRKPSWLINLKRDYNKEWDLHYGPTHFSDLFYTVGAKEYPGNPWTAERER